MIAKDKVQHFIYGCLIALVVGSIVASNGNEFNNASVGCWFGFIVGSFIGLLKEVVWDKALKKGTYDLLDFIFTMAGSAIASILLYLIIK